MKKNYLIILSASAILVGGYFIYRHYKSKPKDVAVDAEEATKEVEKSTGQVASQTKLLSKGSKGIEVGILQKAMKDVDVDNDFGTKTQTRLKQLTGSVSTTLQDYNAYMKKKTGYLQTLQNHIGGLNYPVAQTFELGFLKAWADSVSSGGNLFSYNGSEYNSKTGKKTVYGIKNLMYEGSGSVFV